MKMQTHLQGWICYCFGNWNLNQDSSFRKNNEFPRVSGN